MENLSRKTFRVKYEPRKWQKRLHKIASLKRFIILCFHRRAGKSYFCIAEMIHSLITFDKKDPVTGKVLRNPKAALVASTIGQAERTAMLYLQDMLADIPNVKFNKTKNRVTFPHPNPEYGVCTIQLWGAQNYDDIRGDYLDVAVLDEFAILPPDLYNKVIMPMLTDRSGKMLIISTPQGTNSFYKLYKIAESKPHIWHAETMNVFDTGLIPDSELEIIRETIPEDAWRQEYLCDWRATPEGLYFAKEMTKLEEEGAFSSFPYDGQSIVHTSWDLGHNDSTAICFFIKKGMATIYIDYLEDRGKGLDYYVQKIKEKGYNYGKHFLPHDVAVKELSTGRDRLSFLVEHGLKNIIVVPKTSNLSEVIHLTRNFLPTCRFDEKKCSRLIDCLKSYQRKYDPKTDTFGDKPIKNFSTHGVDSFRTYIQVASLNYLNENPFIEDQVMLEQDIGFDPYTSGENNYEQNKTRGRDFFRQYARYGNGILSR